MLCLVPPTAPSATCDHISHVLLLRVGKETECAWLAGLRRLSRGSPVLLQPGAFERPAGREEGVQGQRARRGFKILPPGNVTENATLHAFKARTGALGGSNRPLQEGDILEANTAVPH